MAYGTEKRRNVNDADGVQNPRVSSVSQQGSGDVQDAGRVRRILDVRPFLLHNAHIREERNRDARCPICTAQVGQAVGYLEHEVRVEPEVGSGGGDDEGGSTSLSLGDLVREFGDDRQVRTAR